MFLTTAEEADPKGSQFNCSDCPPPNLQPGHLKLHQKDVFSASVGVAIEGAPGVASHPGIVAGGIHLRKVVSWAV
jgi:hypothetical protein